MRTREGGHSADRVIHAGGDATGAEIERTLLAARSAAEPAPAVLADHVVLDVVLDEHGRAAGVTVLDEDGRIGVVRATAVVLATGGAGHLFADDDQPGSRHRRRRGHGTAGRRGHRRPGVRAVPPDDAVDRTRRDRASAAGHRGGARRRAVLIDAAGVPVMTGVHPLGDLAPRDVVSLAITRRLAAAPGGITDHVFLDATAIPVRGVRRAGSRPCRCLPGHRRRPVRAPDPGGTGGALPLRRGASPTWSDARRCPASGRSARSPAPVCTARIGWPPTRCSRVW